MEASGFNPLARFLCHCSGAYPQILKECPTEINKYTGIGATILFTGLLAALSGGYAIHTVFSSSPFATAISLVLGLLWGLLVFNLDRYIVSSLRKGKNKRNEWLMALPRLVIAVIISLVIARPLEVRIFQDRIERQLHEIQLAKLMEDKKQVQELYENQSLEDRLLELDHQIIQYEQQLHNFTADQALQQQRQTAEKARAEYEQVRDKNEASINYINKKIQQVYAQYPNRLFDAKGKLVAESIPPAVYRQVQDYKNQSYRLYLQIKEKRERSRELEERFQQLKDEKNHLVQQRIEQLKAEHRQVSLQKQRADSLAMVQINKGNQVNAVTYSANFITQLEALGELTSVRFTTIWWASWFISMLFLVVETSPILVKLMTGRGPYDAVLERYENEVLLLNSKKAYEQQHARGLAESTGPPVNRLQKQVAPLRQVVTPRPLKQPRPAAVAKAKPPQTDMEQQRATASANSSAPHKQPQKWPQGAGQVQTVPVSEQREAPGMAYLKHLQQQTRNGVQQQLQNRQAQPNDSALLPLLQGKTWRKNVAHSLDNPFECLVFRRSYAAGTAEVMMVQNGDVSYGNWKIEGNELQIFSDGLPQHFRVASVDDSRLLLKQHRTGSVLAFSRI